MLYQELLLAIDFGTQSVRAIIFDLNGTIVQKEQTKIVPYFSNQNGWAEQHPDYFWTQLAHTTQKLLIENQHLVPHLKAVTLTTQRGTVINLDKNYQPLRPAIVWLDQRQADASHFPNGFTGLALRMVNMRESVKHAVKNGECNWLMQNEPDIWEKTHKYVFLSGYLTYKLTDNFSDSVANTVGYVPFDYKKQQWANSNHLNYKMFPVERHLLPNLVKPGELLGEISKTASSSTGIPAGLPLIAASSDKSSEVLGSGVINNTTACLSYGTTATLQTTQSHYKELIRFFPAYPGAVPNTFHTEVMIYRGFWMISWFKKQFAHKEKKLAKKLGISPEHYFDQMIADIPPGSLGLTLQPYWSPGVKMPGTEAKGAIIGFGDVHTKAHIYRAILEGLAYALKEGLALTEKRTHQQINEIVVSGGGSQSEVAMQLTADIFNKTTHKPFLHETSALGAAINAAKGMGYFSSYEQAVQHMCRIGKTYEPIAENQQIYQELYEKVYRKMYSKLSYLYHQIRDITGYPEKI